ncbi:hypothetical protein ACIFQM_09900 [Paenibacillus sp. NRS-1782]|uniref:hypothetical protein n=1 Tax=unclassified Paenibacillus TaxID=185978 RepID=UPI003D2C2CCD
MTRHLNRFIIPRVEPELIRKLDIQQRTLFRQLVFKQNASSITEICRLLNAGERTVREKIKKWIEEGFLEPKDPEAQRIRTIVLSVQYEELAVDIRNESEKYQYLLGSND